MLNVSKVRLGRVTKIGISGMVGKHADFERLIGPIAGEVHVYCGEVSLFNGSGVVNWVRYFSALRRRGAMVKFYECSSAVVEMLGFIRNFTCGGEVASVLLPLACEACGDHKNFLFQADDLRKLDLAGLSAPCRTCVGRMNVDDGCSKRLRTVISSAVERSA